MESTTPHSKRIVDGLNSAAWFAMDALWMFRQEWPAYITAGLAVATGLLLLVMALWLDRGALFADLGVNCWIAMNTIWLVSDLQDKPLPLVPAAIAAALGALFIILAAWQSGDFRRLRIFRR